MLIPTEFAVLFREDCNIIFNFFTENIFLNYKGLPWEEPNLPSNDKEREKFVNSPIGQVYLKLINEDKFIFLSLDDAKELYCYLNNKIFDKNIKDYYDIYELYEKLGKFIKSAIAIESLVKESNIIL